MIDKATYERFAKSPATFRDSLLIDVDGVAQRFSKVMDDWQRKDFEAIDPALLRCVGRSDAKAKMRAYLERPRGHSKTQDLAITAVWLLAFATRPLRGYSYAADRDQAGLLKDAVSRIIRLNPWIGELLSVDRDKVINHAPKHPGRDSQLKIETSDVASSYGILPDFIIADEFTHWQGDGSLWESLISSAAKRETCLMLGISNAGFMDSWQWRIREIIRTDEEWFFSRLDGPHASWMTEKRLEEQRRMLPPVAFGRLWLNQWSSGGGDALTPEDIDAAFRHDLEPMTGHRRELENWQFVAGVDLGVKRDCSAVVTLAVGRRRTKYQGKIHLATHKLWQPTADTKVDIRDVEAYIKWLDTKFELEAIGFDPWNAEMLAARCEAHKKARSSRKFNFYDTPWMKEIPPTGANLRDIASLTIECFVDRRLAFYECPRLRSDLLKLRVEEKTYGLRLTSPRDSSGHGDLFSAFSLALLIGHELSTKKRPVAGVISFEDTRSPMQRGMDRIRKEQALRELEEEELGGPYDSQELVRDFLQDLRD